MNPTYCQDTEKKKMKAPSQQDMAYFDHIKKRQDDKGCLCATYVLLLSLLYLFVCLVNSSFKFCSS